MLSQELVEQEEESIREAINLLSDNERKNLFYNAKKDIKDPDTYAALNWFFVAGLHHFYLRRWIKGSIDLVVFLIGVVLIFLGQSWPGFFVIIAISIVELYALFRSQLIVQNYNNQVMKKAIEDIKKSSSVVR